MLPEIPTVDDEMLARYDVAGPRYTSYPTAPIWTDAFGPADYAAVLEAAGSEAAQAPLSVYVHIPFCWHMCSYCGCNVVVSRNRERADDYLDLVEREIELVAARLGDRRGVNQVHLGGGTPTFLDDDQQTRLWGMLTRHFDVLPGAEVAVEVNPSVTSLAQLSHLARLGFNRLSLGVQDLHPEVQAAIGRDQTFEQTQAFVDLARGLGFHSINFDLIYGLPHQTPRRFAETLAQVLALAPDRIACYSFAFVPDVKPNQRKLDASALPRGRAKLDLLRQAWQAFASAGYAPIGMDHFAAPHDSLAHAAAEGRLWRNFMGYTVRQAGDTIAFGVTGISEIHGAFAQNVRSISEYREALAAGRLPTEKGLLLTAEDRRRQHLITGLMCNLSADLGPEGEAHFGEALRPLEADGLCALRDGRVEVLPRGRLFLRNIAMVFDDYLGNSGERPRFSRTI